MPKATLPVVLTTTNSATLFSDLWNAIDNSSSTTLKITDLISTNKDLEWAESNGSPKDLGSQSNLIQYICNLGGVTKTASASDDKTAYLNIDVQTLIIPLISKIVSDNIGTSLDRT